MDIIINLKGIKYTLTNKNLQVGDEVYLVTTTADIDGVFYVTGFPDEPHIIQSFTHSEYIITEVKTDKGYGSAKEYYKIIDNKEI